ncbi:MAG: SDR family oxidoreductase [Mariprofundus sp.]|nr:SDR family oxidoreductase [Mariprofundus sp.]
MNILITGANRGIGLGFVRHYLSKGDSVWACYRSDPGKLGDIHARHLYTVKWDIATDDGPLGELPDSIDILINNAGIYGPEKDGQSLENITTRAMHEVFNVDCTGPLRVVQRLKSRVVASKGVIANISSKMGSSADNTSGGTYAYRAAKAGLVIVSKSMAVDLAPFGVHVITLHPGWVQTDMTHQTGLVDVETSVAGLTQVIANAQSYAAGEFIAFDGRVVPY